MENKIEINEYLEENSMNGISEDCLNNPNLTNNTNSLEDEKLKGDAIGNTMYSERFVLKTLLKLKDIKFDEELESDMCTIWDMTTEKDVVNFLLENNFIELTIDVLIDSKELRLIEILIGIIGNMTVYPEAAIKTIENPDIDVLLSQISSVSDTPTLIQIMRVYKALLYSTNIDHTLLLNDNKLESINFILKSSRNLELLLYTIQVTTEIITLIRDKSFEINFIDNVNEAFNEVLKNIDDGCITHDLQKAIGAYFKVLDNLSSILNSALNDNQSKYDNIRNTITDTSIKQTMNSIEIMLNICTDLEFMQNNTEIFEYIMYCSANFLVTFKTPFDENILKHVCNSFNIIVENNLVFETDVNESIVTFLIYSFLNVNINDLNNIFKTWPHNKIKNLFVNNLINKHECNNRFKEIVNNLCNL